MSNTTPGETNQYNKGKCLLQIDTYIPKHQTYIFCVMAGLLAFLFFGYLPNQPKAEKW